MTAPGTDPVPVLMYHSVAADPPAATRGLAVHPAAFARQLDALVDDGVTTVTFAALMAARRGETALPPRPVVLTFDDGYADFVDTALPLLADRGQSATLFVTTGWLADAGRHAAGTPLDRTLSWAGVAEVAASPVEVGAHSHSHAQLDQLTETDLHAELTVSRALLADHLGRAVPSLAYPYGYRSRGVVAGVRAAGYEQAAAVDNALAVRGDDPWAVPRMTVKRTTSPETVRALVAGRAVGRTFRVDHALTAGYGVVRSVRRGLAGVRAGG